MKQGTTGSKVSEPIEKRPIEWDFRWVGSEDEADHAYLLELTREVIRQANLRLGKPKEKKALIALVEAMAVAASGLATHKGAAAVLRLEKAQFMIGVMVIYATGIGDVSGRLPTAFARMKTIRSFASQPRGASVGITELPAGKPFTLFNFGGESYFLLKIPKGVTANVAKNDFAVWADTNLPAGKVPVGGRPDLNIVKLLRLAYYRFDQEWLYPRPHAGFAVAVRDSAAGTMSPAFTEFGNRSYASFMSLRANQPKPSTWTEYVSAAEAELEPLVAEILVAAKSLV